MKSMMRATFDASSCCWSFYSLVTVLTCPFSRDLPSFKGAALVPYCAGGPVLPEVSTLRRPVCSVLPFDSQSLAGRWPLSTQPRVGRAVMPPTEEPGRRDMSPQSSALWTRVVYVGLVLAILLHRAESWCLTEVFYNRLRRFHARGARTMCRATLRRTREHKISTVTLLQRLDIKSIGTYISQRRHR